jgi:glycolate oxidase
VPGGAGTLAAAFVSAEAAATACTLLARRRILPSLLELLDDATLEVVDRAQGTDLRSRGEALVIAQFDGAAAATELALAVEVLRPWATWLHHATDPEEAAALVEARRLALPSIERFGVALIEDICVPRSRLAEAFARLRAIRTQTGAAMYTFAHAGDGNLHPILSYDRSLDGPPAATREAADRIFALALELGGTVTGEHGVGSLKREWLRRELGDDALAVHADIKRALDPLGVLNPGKAF